MGSNSSCILAVSTLMMIMAAGFGSSGSSDLDKAKQECAPQLVGLSPCLDYVSGEGIAAPSKDCCTAVKLVLKSSRKCLCLLIKYSDDPNLGLKINQSAALGLPNACHAASNISECPALLHLDPNSADAKMFNDYAKKAAGTTSSPASAATSSNSTSSRGGSSSVEVKNDGGKGLRCLGAVQMVYATVVVALVGCYVSNGFCTSL
ncbi:hypothetical protein Nepgr_012116 [Nepenthes gracilis]|uniref:Bifunctional inhibitor/plant lipid transfer protein/seed storage helical domain-containing protein n=1 Tax=Nepenthes gracilis TaxID=150966 RepID=A0AAD3XN20_NEPGR|nr:hypothetical protein Nepgr_012116 [Nepenthes gracilis]